jgi:putative acetyltransferase
MSDGPIRQGGAQVGRGGMVLRPIRDLEPAGMAKLEELADLWVESWTSTLPDIDFAARRPWLKQRLIDLRAQGVAVIVAVDSAGGRLLGFVSVDRLSGHLDQLAVARQAWGSGAAVALLNEAKALSPGRLDLEVNVANRRAVRFYEREGFIQNGEGLSAASGLPIQFMVWSRQA